MDAINHFILNILSDYRWSSYRANAQGEVSSLLTQHMLYRALGADEINRRLNYRDLFWFQLDTGMVDEIRKATNGNYALGSERFKEQVPFMLNRRVVPGLSGRPKKQD